MYNFNFLDNEKLIEIFEEVMVKQNNNEKITTIALTDMRLLFLDYITNDGFEALRITKGINFVKYKDVYCEFNLNEIIEIIEEGYYRVRLIDDRVFEFNNKKLYELLIGMN